MAGLLIRTITNIRHQSTSLELPPDPRINTLGPTPAWLLQNALGRIRYHQSGEDQCKRVSSPFVFWTGDWNAIKKHDI